MDAFTGQHIWIIGASTGIGAATARELTKEGAILALSARSADKLSALQEELGSQHQVFPVDVADTAAMSSTVSEITQKFPRIDRIIYLAAIYDPMPLGALDLTKTRALIETNLFGAFNLIHAVLPILRAQKGGQLALCGSVAGYRGLPNGQPYSATKAAIINLAESLRVEEAPHNIDIRLINPGFVRTPMTAVNTFPMPMIMEPEDAAKALVEGLASSSFEISFPKKFTAIMKVLRLLPDFIFFKLARHIGKS